MTTRDSRGAATRLIHAGERPPAAASLTVPIYATSTFVFDSAADIEAYAAGTKSAYLYSRYDNPTVVATEAKLAEIDGAEASLVFASGMAAISTAIFGLLNAGDEVVCCAAIYGGTGATPVAIFDRDDESTHAPAVGFDATLDRLHLIAAWDAGTNRRELGVLTLFRDSGGIVRLSLPSTPDAVSGAVITRLLVERGADDRHEGQAGDPQPVAGNCRKIVRRQGLEIDLLTVQHNRLAGQVLGDHRG